MERGRRVQFLDSGSNKQRLTNAVMIIQGKCCCTGFELDAELELRFGNITLVPRAGGRNQYHGGFLNSPQNNDSMPRTQLPKTQQPGREGVRGVPPFPF